MLLAASALRPYVRGVYELSAIAARLARLGRDAGADNDGVPHAAVAAIFRPARAGGSELFFIRRAEREGDPWSGHIAFPGGRREESDASLLACAMRETIEEVGIDLSRAELLARLPDVPAFTRSKRGTMIVAPFVFALEADVVPTPNVEVAEAMWVPFESLARGDGKGTFLWKWEGKELDLPCIRLGAEQHVLWGMTYRMLETLLEALISPPPNGDEIVGG
jgi:8-oxo-dGTP pyrophosphatase MutT (NUDIX family)